MEHAGLVQLKAGPAATVIAEKYITGELKREHLYKNDNFNFMPEYKDNGLLTLRALKGLCVEPNKQDSIQKKEKQKIKSLEGALRISTEQQNHNNNKIK